MNCICEYYTNVIHLKFCFEYVRKNVYIKLHTYQVGYIIIAPLLNDFIMLCVIIIHKSEKENSF